MDRTGRCRTPASRGWVRSVAALAAVVALAGCRGGGHRSGAGTPIAPSPAPASTATGRNSNSTTGSTAPAAAGTSGAATTWTTYQGNQARSGVAAPQPPLTPLAPAWNASLDGSAVYGQALLAGGRVIVATEDDDVFAIDPHDGRIVWTVRLGTPLRDVDALAGCGDIDPLGVTSTPVVDPATGTLYVVGEVSTGGGTPVRHELAAITVSTGRVLATEDVDPPLPSGESRVQLLQRAALALGNGRVYIGYGGQYGDCGRYHGWVVSVPAIPAAGASPGGPAGGTAAGETAFDVTPESTGGAVWGSGSGPSIGPGGAVFVTTGNPDSGGPSPWAESVVKLGPDLGAVPLADYRDRLASGDLDLSTGGALVLADGDVFAAGKTDTGYVLRQRDLSLAATIDGRICGSDPDGGAAFDDALDSIYLPCMGGGIQQVRLSDDTAGWRAGSVNSTVVLAGGDLWALGYPGGTLEELDAASGAVLYRTAVGRTLPHFASLTIVDGLLLVPTTEGIMALDGPAGPPAEG